MKETILLKYNKDISLKTGALASKMYVFMLSIIALMVAISSAVFELICYKSGFSEAVYNKYTLGILYISLGMILVWLVLIPIWFPGTLAETTVYVKKDGKLYKIRNRKDNMFDREKYLENTEFLNAVIEKLPKENEHIKIECFEDYNVLKKTKKYAILNVKKEGRNKKIKIYNVYENFEKIV